MITRNWIAAAARQSYASVASDDTSFTASSAWVFMVMRRKDMLLCWRTNLMVLFDDVLVHHAADGAIYATAQWTSLELKR